MKITAELRQSPDLPRFLTKLKSPDMQIAAARGLNEHTDEQRKQSIVRMVATTGVSQTHVSRMTRVIRAAPSASMAAMVQTQDSAIAVKYGASAWSGSQTGAPATAWRRAAFKGQELVLANELADPSRPNVPAAEKSAALDLEKRVVRYVLRTFGI